jgi:GNAT superfamily N-acetyltransferase
MQPLASEETIRMVFGRTKHELISLMDRHTLTVQAWLSSRSPQAETFQGKGVRASSTGLNVRLLNLALGCHFPAGTRDSEIDEEIKAVKDFFAQRNVRWFWWMNAFPSITDVRSFLEERGFEPDDPPLPAMAASLRQDISALPTYPKNICVWQAETVKDLQVASLIRRTAFKFREGEALTYFEDMASDWLENDSVKLFLAGESPAEPVSIGAMIFAEGIPGVYVMATLPEHHRKGYGKAILTSIMSEAAARGHELIVLTASAAGFGLYAQFGFHHIFGFDFYKRTE